MGPAGRKDLIGLFPYRALIDLRYILLLLSCFYPRYLRNIPCTKTRDFGMQISCFPIFGKSSLHFSLLNTPWSPKRSFWAGYLPAYVCGLGILRLQLFLRLSIHKVFLICPLFLTFYRRRKLFVSTLAQKLYGTCNSILCVLNYFCLWLLFS